MELLARLGDTRPQSQHTNALDEEVDMLGFKPRTSMSLKALSGSQTLEVKCKFWAMSHSSRENIDVKDIRGPGSDPQHQKTKCNIMPVISLTLGAMEVSKHSSTKETIR